MAWYDEKDNNRDSDYGWEFKVCTPEEEQTEKAALEAAMAAFAAAGLPTKPVKEHNKSTWYEFVPGFWIYSYFRFGYMTKLWFRIKTEEPAKEELVEFITGAEERILKEMGAEWQDLAVRGTEFIEKAENFLSREHAWINGYNKRIEKIYSLIKNNQYRYIKIATGINNRTGRPNFQVYLDRDKIELETHIYGIHKGLKTLRGEYVEAKNISECGTYHEFRWKQYQDLFVYMAGSSTHEYKLGNGLLCSLINEYVKSGVSRYLEDNCVFLNNKYVEA